MLVLCLGTLAGCGGGGTGAQPATTVDGTIVFASTVKKHADIYRLDGEGTHRMATDGSAADAEPAWSPDGQFVAYITDKNQLSVIKIDPNVPGVLLTAETSDMATAPRNPAWLPNGTISYETAGRLVVVQPTGQKVRELVPAGPDRTGTFAGAYAWSPDGTLMVFGCGDETQPAVCLLDVQSGKSRVLLEPRWTFGAFDWSPDSKTIVAGASSVDGQAGEPSDLYVFDANGKGLHALAQAGNESNPVWSPDGRTIAFESDRGPSGLWVMNADGSGAKELMTEISATHPDWVAP